MKKSSASTNASYRIYKEYTLQNKADEIPAGTAAAEDVCAVLVNAADAGTIILSAAKNSSGFSAKIR